MLFRSDDSLVEYKEAEPFTTRDKKVDVTKAERDLGHDPRVALEEGVALTVAWMCRVYRREETQAVAASGQNPPA